MKIGFAVELHSVHFISEKVCRCFIHALSALLLIQVSTLSCLNNETTISRENVGKKFNLERNQAILLEDCGEKPISCGNYFITQPYFL